MPAFPPRSFEASKTPGPPTEPPFRLGQGPSWPLPPPLTWQKSLFVVAHTEAILLQLTGRNGWLPVHPQPPRLYGLLRVGPRGAGFLTLHVFHSCLWGPRLPGFASQPLKPHNGLGSATSWLSQKILGIPGLKTLRGHSNATLSPLLK